MINPIILFLRKHLLLPKKIVVPTVAVALVISVLFFFFISKISSSKEIVAQDDTSLKELPSINKSIDKISEDYDREIEVKYNPKENQLGQRNQLINFIAFLSILANSLIAFFIYKNHRERMAILSDKKFVQPEEVQKHIQSFTESISECKNLISSINQENQTILRCSTDQTEKVLKIFHKDSLVHGEDVKKLLEMFKLLKGQLDEKDKEIRRYKEGYDISLIKRFASGYLKVRDRILDYIEKDKTGVENLENLNVILNSTIQTAGLTEIVINIGDNYYDDKYIGKIDTPSTTLTNDPMENNKIASIDKIGYEILGNEVEAVLSMAKVTIYKFKEKE
jgi:flagellar biosynthesis/type III secretory pathway chaperone